MNTDKTIIFAVMILFFITVVPSALFFRKIPAAELLPSEKVFVNFSSVPVVVVTEPRREPLFSGLDCPVKAPPKQDVMPVKSLPPPEPVVVKLPPKIPKVSMIYYEFDATKRAIIGGHILQVGSIVDDTEVLDIEKNRVKIRIAGKDIWLNMQ